MSGVEFKDRGTTRGDLLQPEVGKEEACTSSSRRVETGALRVLHVEQRIGRVVSAREEEKRAP